MKKKAYFRMSMIARMVIAYKYPSHPLGIRFSSKSVSMQEFKDDLKRIYQIY